MPYKNKDRQRDFQNNWIKARREAWLKANGPCRKCRSWDDLQVDHVDSSFKVSHRIWSLSKEKREAELQKCQPLCANCHRRKTSRQLRAHAKFQHGWRKLSGISNSSRFVRIGGRPCQTSSITSKTKSPN